MTPLKDRITAAARDLDASRKKQAAIADELRNLDVMILSKKAEAADAAHSTIQHQALLDALNEEQRKEDQAAFAAASAMQTPQFGTAPPQAAVDFA